MKSLLENISRFRGRRSHYNTFIRSNLEISTVGFMLSSFLLGLGLRFFSFRICPLSSRPMGFFSGAYEWGGHLHKNTLKSHFCPKLKSFIKKALISVNISLISLFIILQYVPFLWKYRYFLRNVSISIFPHWSFHHSIKRQCLMS